MSTMPKGRKRKADYDEVVAYVAANPIMHQSEVATHFGISQCRVSHILAACGVQGIRRGRPLKAKPGQTSEQAQWETILHNAGLGMERGLRLHNQRILYGYDPLKQSHNDDSATLQPTI